MRTKLMICCALPLILISLHTKAQQVLTLDSVLSLVAKNPALSAFDAQANAENAYAEGAKNLDAPKLSAGQFMTPYKTNPNMGAFMVTGEQMFTNPAKLKAKKQFEQAKASVTLADKSALQNQLFAQAREAYAVRVVLEKKLNLLQNIQALFDYMLKDANIRLTYNKEKLSNIYKVKARLYQLDNTRAQLQNEVNQQNIMLNTLMNRDPSAVFAVDTNIVAQAFPLLSSDTASLASARSDIKSIDRNIDLHQLQAKMAYSERKPDFGIQAGHMFTYGANPDQYTLMASVTIPISPWSSKRYKADLKGLGYEVAALQQQRLDVLNRARGQLAALEASIQSQQKQLDNDSTRIIPAFQHAYKTALLTYEQNTGDLPAVLDAIDDLQQARMAALDDMQALFTLQIAYEKELEKY
ncbi:TolC family protein [Mucilaginibacter segetis]|uniref:TolC family protein n=1 Tax=Mucilaginibacter segetis TaxID=2793071 RepID=A0A934PR46_9SPHI|nr:TolC family protein [Mucilaginibacter segetis]MBK0379233.1 TolC family protein [Mucilaginibacter segetis]